MNDRNLSTGVLVNLIDHVKQVNKDLDAQKEKLIEFEQTMRLGPVAAAAKLDTPYTTYKAWKNGRNKMPGCAYTAINLWLSIEPADDTIEGELDAVHEDY